MSLRNRAGRLLRGIRRLFDRRAWLARKVKATKRARASRGEGYKDKPKLSLIVLSFNHCAMVRPILEGLRRTVADELIVCEDGSIDGSEKLWLRHLTGPNEFMIRSNDLHEIRAYNRAIDFARGEFVCVLQDDDIPPERGEWVNHALALFDRYPKLAALGGYAGLWLEFSHAGVKKVKIGGIEPYPNRDIPFVDPVLGIPFMFAESVNIGPIFFRRDVFRSMGGFDLEFSRPGEPGIHLDVAISLRAWLSEWHVGLYEAQGFQRRVGGQGTALFGKDERARNHLANLVRLKRAYADAIPAIDRKIEQLNRELVRRESFAPAGKKDIETQ